MAYRREGVWGERVRVCVRVRVVRVRASEEGRIRWRRRSSKSTASHTNTLGCISFWLLSLLLVQEFSFLGFFFWVLVGLFVISQRKACASKQFTRNLLKLLRLGYHLIEMTEKMKEGRHGQRRVMWSRTEKRWDGGTRRV